MTDKLTPAQRHYCMSRIRSKNTRPEWVVRRFLFSNGYRYRIHVKQLPGTPDIVIQKLNTCIFVNGCFWHGHEDCSLYVLPKTNQEFWTNKINRNQARDHKAQLELKALGWHTIVIWECQLRPKQRQLTLKGLLRTLNYIDLQNKGAHFKYNYDEEESSYMAAED